MGNKIDQNDLGSQGKLESETERLLAAADVQRGERDLLFDDELLTDYPTERNPLIHGLLREGEVMNVIAAPKRGKSWGTLGMAIAVAYGLEWMDFKCEPGMVLVIDNELHRETLASRYRKILQAMGIQPQRRVAFIPLRGKLKDIKQLDEVLSAWVSRYDFKLMILDAFYRTIPEGSKEEDNSQMTSIFNLIDCYAEKYGCAFAAVHHLSKGLQSGKQVTDLGSGAGAISRAVDTHLTLRQHKEKDCVVLSAACRSWPAPDDKVLRFKFPLWEVATDLSTADVEDGKKKKEEKGIGKQLDVEAFVASCVRSVAEHEDTIISRAVGLGYKSSWARTLLNRSVTESQVVFKFKKLHSTSQDSINVEINKN